MRRDGSLSGATTVNQTLRDFPELTRRLDGFSSDTRKRLSRSLVHALRGRRHDARTLLDDAVSDGCRELRAAGKNDQAIMEFFGALVEETGRACGADRPSLVSGELRWVPVRARVLELVRDALVVTAPATFLAMDHVNGPR
jgi:hypothetical protein